MSIQAVTAEFEQRLFAWGRQDLLREIAQGYPLLLLVHGGEDWHALEHLPEAARQVVVEALFKRWNRLPLDPQLAAVLRCFDDDRSRLRLEHPELLVRPPKVNRGALAKAALAALRPVLGEPEPVQRMKRWWDFTTAFGPWTVTTTVVLSERDPLGYHHALYASGDKLVSSSISLRSWMALSSHTEWSGITDADIPEVASGLTRIVQHFLDACPKLLVGLPPPGA